MGFCFTCIGRAELQVDEVGIKVKNEGVRNESCGCGNGKVAPGSIEIRSAASGFSIAARMFSATIQLRLLRSWWPSLKGLVLSGLFEQARPFGNWLQTLLRMNSFPVEKTTAHLGAGRGIADAAEK